MKKIEKRTFLCLLLAAAFLLMFRNGETRGRGRGKA